MSTKSSSKIVSVRKNQDIFGVDGEKNRDYDGAPLGV